VHSHESPLIFDPQRDPAIPMKLLRTLGIVLACVLAPLIYTIILEVTGMDRISRDSEHKLRPIIQYVEDFRKDTGRLPTDEEFHRTADSMAWMVVLRTKEDSYAARNGAKTSLDYMVGIWRADWYHYYKSWDHEFMSAADEMDDLWNGRGEAQADARMLSIGLIIYQRKHRKPPFILVDGNSASVYASGSQQNVFYDDIPPDKISPAGEFLDPWKHPFTFRIVSDKIVVSSAGPDGRRETADDISSEN
jgi:hypothetical protein